MKQIKLVFTTVMLTLALFTMATLESCKKKKSCKDILCLHDGICMDGRCKCPAGWTGDRCQDFDIAGYIKIYNAADQNCLAAETYTSSIALGAGDTVIMTQMTELMYQGQVKGTRKDNIITIFPQTSNTVEISGTGTMEGGEINWAYTTSVFGFPCVCTGVWK